MHKGVIRASSLFFFFFLFSWYWVTYSIQASFLDWYVALHYLDSCGCCWADFWGVCTLWQWWDGNRLEGLYIGLKQIGSWIGNVSVRTFPAQGHFLSFGSDTKVEKASTSWSLSLCVCACVCWCVDSFAVHQSRSEAVGKSGRAIQSQSCNLTWTQLYEDLWPQSVTAFSLKPATRLLSLKKRQGIWVHLRRGLNDGDGLVSHHLNAILKKNPQERADCSQCVFRVTLHVKLSKWKCVLLQIRPRRIRVQASITPQGRFFDLYAFLKKVCTLPRCSTSVSRGGRSGTGLWGQIPPAGFF